MRTTKFMLMLPLAAIMLTTGCRVLITPPASGTVVSQSGTYTCTADAPCDINVADLMFNETFVAQPADGFTFSQWKREGNHFCGGSSAPCELTTGNFGDFPLLLALLERFDLEFLLVPEFTRVAEVDADWTGTWQVTNTNTDLSGTIALGIAQTSEQGFDVTLDLGGSIGGIVNPAPQTVSVTADEDGELEFEGGIDLGGEDATLYFSLDSSGNLEFEIDDIPQEAFDSIEAEGFLGADGGTLDWAIELESGVRIKGKAAVTRG